MTITDDIKAKIEAEYKQWENMQYCGKDKKERQKMSQFFTPPALVFKMLEKFPNLEGNVLDPTCGAGGLLAAAIIAGADPKKCYGIELDPDVAALARVRLAKLGVPRHHIKVGDALDPSSYIFLEPKSEPSTAATTEKKPSNTSNTDNENKGEKMTSTANSNENCGTTSRTTKKVRVAQMTLTGKIVKTYDSMRQAYMATHIKNLHLAVRGDIPTAGGYKWVAC